VKKSVTAESDGDVRRKAPQDVEDRELGVLALTEQMRDRRRQDEEGKECEDRQIGKVACVDEPVVVNADRDPLDDFPDRHLGLQLLLNLRAEGRAHAG